MVYYSMTDAYRGIQRIFASLETTDFAFGAFLEATLRLRDDMFGKDISTGFLQSSFLER